MVFATLLTGSMVFGLAGCGSANAGDTASERFNAEFAGDPEVAELRTGGSNTLPWAGSLTGTVVAKDGLDDAELGGLVDRIGQYSAESPSTMSISVDLLADDVLFPVRNNREANEKLLGLVSEVRADGRIAAAELGAGSGSYSDVDFTVEVAADAFEIASSHKGDVERLALPGDPSESAKITVQTADEELMLQGPSLDARDWIDQAEQAWGDLAAEVTLVKFELVKDQLEVTVAQDEDVETARGVIESALAESGIKFTVSSGTFGLNHGAEGESARLLVEQLDQAVRDRVVKSWTDDQVLQLTVTSADDVQSVADAVAFLDDATEFSTIALFVSAPGTTGDRALDRSLSVYADPAELPGRAAHAVDLLAASDVVSAFVSRDEVNATSSKGLSGLASLAGPLKRAAKPDDWVCAYSEEGSGSLCFATADTIESGDVNDPEHPSANAFIAAWNSAPSGAK